MLINPNPNYISLDSYYISFPRSLLASRSESHGRRLDGGATPTSDGCIPLVANVGGSEVEQWILTDGLPSFGGPHRRPPSCGSQRRQRGWHPQIHSSVWQRTSSAKIWQWYIHGPPLCSSSYPCHGHEAVANTTNIEENPREGKRENTIRFS